LDADAIYLALAGINATIYAIIGGASIVTAPHWNEERYRIETGAAEDGKALIEELAKRSGDKTESVPPREVAGRVSSAYIKWLEAPRAMLPFGLLKFTSLRRDTKRLRTALELERRKLEKDEKRLQELEAEMKVYKRTFVELQVVMSRHYLLQKMLDQLSPLLVGGIILPLILVEQSYDDRFSLVRLGVITIEIFPLLGIHGAIVDLSFGPDEFGKQEEKTPLWRRVLRRPKVVPRKDD